MPGLLERLASVYGQEVMAPDVFAYAAAAAAHSGYVSRFADDLSTPGLRIPLTADAHLFQEALELGRRVIWLQTFGTRYVDDEAGRPMGPPHMAGDERPLVKEAIPDTLEGMPETVEYDDATQTLNVGRGRIAPLSQAVWEYETSGYKLVRRWFNRRKREPEGRKSSPLDEIVATQWRPEWTTELLEVLNVIGLLIRMEADQAELLDRILGGAVISNDDLGAYGIPTGEPPKPEKPTVPGQLST